MATKPLTATMFMLTHAELAPPSNLIYRLRLLGAAPLKQALTQVRLRIQGK